MKRVSLDPRVTRMHLEEGDLPSSEVLHKQDHWITYEVFHQKKRGAQHQHVGIVHAPNADMAVVLAKEQYARRGTTTSLWVVKSADVHATAYEDSDIFDSTPEKLHREASPYKVKDKIKRFKEKQNAG